MAQINAANVRVLRTAFELTNERPPNLLDDTDRREMIHRVAAGTYLPSFLSA